MNLQSEPVPAQGRDPLAGRLPVSIVTGFLGSGKSTLINKLLKRPDMNKVAVIVNEFGEQSIDNDLDRGVLRADDAAQQRLSLLRPAR